MQHCAITGELSNIVGHVFRKPGFRGIMNDWFRTAAGIPGEDALLIVNDAPTLLRCTSAA